MGTQGTVKGEVNFANTPPGTKTSVKSEGNVRTDTRIGFAMPGMPV
jgi:hypothetical protein